MLQSFPIAEILGMAFIVKCPKIALQQSMVSHLRYWDTNCFVGFRSKNLFSFESEQFNWFASLPTTRLTLLSATGVKIYVMCLIQNLCKCGSNIWVREILKCNHSNKAFEQRFPVLLCLSWSGGSNFWVWIPKFDHFLRCCLLRCSSGSNFSLSLRTKSSSVIIL